MATLRSLPCNERPSAHGTTARRSKSQSFAGAEVADYFRGVALVGVYLGVQVAHVFGGDFIGKVGERGSKLGEFGEGVAADDGDGVVRGKIVAVVGEDYEV